jgi:hypothetical protein
MTRFLVCCALFRGLLVVFKRLDPGSSHPTKPLRALAVTPTARDDTALGLGGGLFQGLVVVFRLDTCPYSVLLIRVNLCNLWIYQKHRPLSAEFSLLDRFALFTYIIFTWAGIQSDKERNMKELIIKAISGSEPQDFLGEDK